MSAKIIGLVAHPGKKGSAALTVALREEFSRRGIGLKFDQATARLIGETASNHSVNDLGKECELIIVLGGDGTILRTVHALSGCLRPVFGINLGTLGFLTCLGPADYRQAVSIIADGSYVLSKRVLLEVEVVRAGVGVEQHLGLNDAVISRGALSRLIRLEAHVDGSLLTRYNADGLIVATPTGSTAYSLSAGGPLLTPDSNVFAITPICPHTLTNRSLIIDNQSHIEVRLCDQQDEIYLTVDGQRAIAMQSEDAVRLRRSAQTLELAIMPDLPFFELVRRKLKWSGNSF